MHILYLHQFFATRASAGGTRSYEFARHLVGAGHRVTMIAAPRGETPRRYVADGIDVIGYNYWSLTDNYEWGSYTPRFGLYTVDVLTDPTLTRHPTDAVPAYRDITAADGVPADYRPTRNPGFCSLVDFLSSCLDPVTVP